MHPKTHHSPKPNHIRMLPYDRKQSQKDLTLMVNDYFNNNHQPEHPLLFCAGLEVCFYVTQDCMYSKKKCYYE